MGKRHINLPDRLHGSRVYLRPYQAGDGPLLYEVSRKNRDHLARYESENALLSIQTLADAEDLACALADEWHARRHFFLGVFDRDSDEFVAQIYIGPVDWDPPEFRMGYIADVNHEGQGYVSEAVRVVIAFLFSGLNAHRVRLDCADDNERSWRVAEACGFNRKGHIPHNKQLPDGTLVGTYLYQILREDFLAAGSATP